MSRPGPAVIAGTPMRANAAVVGLLAAALVGLGLSGTVGSLLDATIVAAAFLALNRLKAPPLLVVAGCALAAVAAAFLA